MAEANTEIPADYDYGSLKHIIIWLDIHIGKAGECQLLKKAFSSNLDPRTQIPTMLTDRDLDIILRSSEVVPIRFAGIPFHFLAFDDPYRCYEAFERHRDKHIYFITSGTMGEHVVPMLIQNHVQLFVDPITNTPYCSIYIFCGNIEYHSRWISDIYEYVQAFDHEADLLARMTRDVAEYFVQQGERQLEVALRHYQWSKKVFDRYTKMGQICRRELANVEKRTADIEAILRPRIHNPPDVENYVIENQINQNNDDDDSETGQPAT
jgi:hypothetical protein